MGKSLGFAEICAFSSQTPSGTLGLPDAVAADVLHAIICVVVARLRGRTPTGAAILRLTDSARTVVRNDKTAVQSATVPGYALPKPAETPSVFFEPTEFHLSSGTLAS